MQKIDLLLILFLTVGFMAAKPAEPTVLPAAVEPFTTPEQLAAKDAAVTHCVMEQNVPVMGFNMKVVCLKPSGQIAWVR
jgi:hypothetical protein